MRALLVAAILPAALLMWWVYRQDTVEQESPRLIVKLLLLGALSCLPASILEGIFTPVLNGITAEGTPGNTFLLAFFVVALVEEGCKLFMLYKGAYRNPEFNYRFDGIVYSVAVSMGFAALENITYALGYGPGGLVARGLLSIPGHATFGVFMGLFFSQSKMAELYSNGVGRRRNLTAALLAPLLLHGIFDFCLMSGSTGLTLLFLGFVILMDILSIRLVRIQAKNDRPIA